MIIPRIKERVNLSGCLAVDNIISCYGCSADAEFAAGYLAHFIAVRLSCEKEDAKLFFRKNQSIQQGGYKIDVGNNVTVEYSDSEGLRNGAATFLGLLFKTERGYCVERTKISDTPDHRYRSVMIDLARGLPDVDRLKEDIRLLSLAKCNYLHLHLMDSFGMCYDSDVFYSSDAIRGTRRYTKRQIASIVEYCKSLGITVVPEIEIPAHATMLVKSFPKLKCKVNFENQSLWAVCAGSTETDIIYDNLIGEICELFPGEYIHVGGDELYFNDLPHLDRLCHWEECSVCTAYMRKHNLNGRQALYYDLMRRVHKMVSCRGRKMIMWNDQLDVSAPVPLPKDIIVQFWRIANQSRGPRKNCSLAALSDQGFKIINSDFPHCYVDLEEYANPEKTSSFRCDLHHDSAEPVKEIIGAEACAWEYGNPEYTHYLSSFAPSVILLLDKMWNGIDAVYGKEYRRALTKLLFGPSVPLEYDVFELFGSIMPPRSNEIKTYAPIASELIDAETVLKHIELLRTLDTYSPVYRNRLLKTFCVEE